MNETSQLPVEVVIACHSPQRRIERAVSSVLLDNGDSASATVVCHNVSMSDVLARIPDHLRARVRFLELHDGIPSPTGPFTLGLERATAPWVSIMGSDDFYEPGALTTMLRMSQGRDAVMARLRHDGGRPVRTPPVRPFRLRSGAPLDAVRDRLFYRSAPLGLMRREALERHGLGLDPGLRVGEDLRMSALLWSLGSISVQRRGPGYVIGSDAADRVTMAPMPVAEELRHISVVWNDACLSRLTGPQTVALATKYLRIHIFGVAYYRALNGDWLPGDRAALAEAVKSVLTRAPSAAEPLARADRDLLDVILDPEADDAEVNRLARRRRRFLHPAALLPRSLAYLMHREAPPRFMAASALVR